MRASNFANFEVMAAKSIKPVSINEAVLDDLASRFLLNIPKEDEDDPMKLCTHMELAYWFYLDLVRPEDSTLPGCSMKEFMAAIFKHCPFLVKDSVMVDLDNYVAQWKAHKYKKPVRGGIILNQDWTKCLLVQGYPASTTWGFPKGKLEEGENDIDAAVREVFEETGFDSRGMIREKWHLVAQVNGSEAKMYIIPGVPDDTHFEPKTRKEIGSIQWFCVDDLPRHKKDLTSKQALGKRANSFFMIMPFISQLRKWIASNIKGFTKTSKGKTISAHFQNPVQQQSYSRSSAPQTHSKTVSPSAPPLDVITRRYGVEYRNETTEHGMGHGGMGALNTARRDTQPPVTTMYRDDTAPIPYPPQHPHTLHPNYTLPAPLHHVSTGYYSPGHNAVYPSHLTYTNTPPHVNQHHHQHGRQYQSPQLHSNHYHHYVQPSTVYHRENALSVQPYGMDSMLRGPDSNPAHAVDPRHVVNVRLPPTESAAKHSPQTAFRVPVAHEEVSSQTHRRMAAAPNQHPQYYHSYHTTAAAFVHTAAAQPPPPPPAPYPHDHYHTHTNSAHPQTQRQLGESVDYHQAFPDQHKAVNLETRPYLPEYYTRSGDKEGTISGMAGLKLEQGGPFHYHSSAEVGKEGYSVVLKSAANMVNFKFDTNMLF